MTTTCEFVPGLPFCIDERKMDEEGKEKICKRERERERERDHRLKLLPPLRQLVIVINYWVVHPAKYLTFTSQDKIQAVLEMTNTIEHYLHWHDLLPGVIPVDLLDDGG